VASEPEILAHHLTEAGLLDDALVCWQKAGELAARRSTFAEAEHHFNTALGLLSDDAPAREIKEKELVLRLALGPVLISANGMAAPEVSENYTRAQELGQELDDFPRRFAALFGLWTYNVQVDSPKASVLSDDMLDLAKRRGESEYLLQAHHAAWTSTFVQGRLAANVAHSDSGWEIYDPDAHRGHAFTYGGHEPRPPLAIPR
jgi:predicted ATPase